MADQFDIAAEVRRLVARRAPVVPTAAALPDDLDLFASGLGLDSVALIELLFDCEASFGMAFSEDFLNAGNFTLGAVVSYIDRTRRG